MHIKLYLAINLIFFGNRLIVHCIEPIPDKQLSLLFVIYRNFVNHVVRITYGNINGLNILLIFNFYLADQLHYQNGLLIKKNKWQLANLIGGKLLKFDNLFYYLMLGRFFHLSSLNLHFVFQLNSTFTEGSPTVVKHGL